MYCQKCGAMNENSAAFCCSCGQSLSGAQPQPAQPQYRQPQPQYRPTRPQYQQAQPQYRPARPQYQQPQPQYQPTQPQYQQAQPQYQQAQPQYQQAQPQYQPTQPQYQQPQPQYQQPQPQNRQEQQYQQQPESSDGTTAAQVAVKYSDPLLDPIKKWFLSPLFLAAAAVFTLMIFFHILNSEYTFVSAIETAKSVLYEIGALTSDMSDMLSALNKLSFLFALIEMLPNIIVAAALWFTVYTVYDKSKKGIYTSGLSVVRKVITAVFVLNIISAVSYAILSLIAFSKIADIGAKLPTSVFITMLAIFAGMIFGIYCVNKAGELLDYIIYTISYRKPVVPSTISTIMPFIFCGSFLCLALLEGELSKWCGALALLGFGLLAIRYKMMIQELQNIARTLESEESAEGDTARSEEPAYYSQMGTAQPYQNETPSRSRVKKFIPLAVIAAVIVGIIVFSTSYTAPNIDKRIVGEWECTDEKFEGTVMEFKRNGTAVISAGSDDEEKATYTAENGVITFNGEVQWNYRVINSNIIEIERYHISSSWEKVYRWYTFRRVD